MLLRRRTTVAAAVSAAFGVLAISCASTPVEKAPPASTSATSPATDPEGAGRGAGPTTATWATPVPATADPTGGGGTAGTDAEATGRIDWHSCGGGAQCGTLTVPIEAGRPEGGTIDLAVARRPASDRNGRIGSLFVNPGGPGASGVAMVTGGGVDARLNERFDVVSWDPRGVGKSRALDCEQRTSDYRMLDWSPDTPDEQRDLDDTARRIAEDCAEEGGAILAHINTDDTARDLERLRRAVGDDQVSFLGFSYGTFIGLRYAALYPTRVRAIVLDGVVDPNDDMEGFLAGQTTALEQQVDELFASCTPPGCTLTDPAAVYDRVAARVEQQPLPAGPGSRSRPTGPTTLAFAAIESSYDESLHATFLAALARADEGDGAGLDALAQRYFATGGYSSYLGVLCSDSPHPVGAEFRTLAAHLRAISPRFGDAVANEVLPCAFWGAPPAIAPGPVHAAGSAPILVVGNTGDVATPYVSAQKVARDLDRGVLLTYEGVGHTSFGKSRCVDRAVIDYLTERTLPDVQQHC